MLGLEISQCSLSVKSEIHHFKLGLTSTVSVATFQCMHMQETCRVIAACIILYNYALAICMVGMQCEIPPLNAR